MSVCPGKTDVLVHHTHYVVTTFDPTVPCVVQTWLGFATSEEFRTATLTVLDFVRQQRAAFPRINFLVDARELGPLLHEDMRWAAAVADPQLRAVGMRRIAFVTPETALGRQAIRAYQEAAQESPAATLESRVFVSRDDAVEWLRGTMDTP